MQEDSKQRRQESITHTMNYCQNYLVENVNIRCKVEVDQKQWKFKDRPCIKGHSKYKDPCSICSQWVRKTLEEGEKSADDWEEFYRKMAIIEPVIAAWKGKEKSDRQEVIECPSCKGKLHLSQSAYNGHVHAQCETKDCYHRME